MKWIFWMSMTLLVGCKHSFQSSIEPSSIEIEVDTLLKGDETVDRIVAPFKQELDSKMHEVIGVAADEFNNDAGSTGESTLGDFISDLLLEESRLKFGDRVDLAVINHRGGLRTSIRKGDVTVENIYELMPFENEMWILELDGARTQMLFDNAARRKSNVIAGATFSIVDDMRADDILIGGVPFDPGATYKVSISDYLAGGGGGHDFLSEEMMVADIDYKCRDMIIDHIKRVSGADGNLLVPKIDERVKMK